ncbi:MAG TPA: TlpA disulfide reductase family protein [Candidatus Baltobacteraceae bacterium]|nr:TlpA disulfide reductase family protein [Candidatus Baltobacteraceae bacterium]
MSRQSRRAAARRKSSPSARPYLIWGSVALVVCLGIFAVVTGRHSVQGAASQAPILSFISTGDQAPNFSVTTDRGRFSLSSARKPVLLELFATWCPHCQRETATMNRLYEKYSSRVRFIAVTASPYGSDRQSPESARDVAAFIQAFNVRYPVAFDPSLRVARSYLQGGYPTIVVIAHDRIRYLTSGETSFTTLDATLRTVTS